MFRLSALAVALSTLALAAASATPARGHVAAGRTFIGPFTGVATGSRDGVSHLDNKSTDPDSHIVSDSHDVYTARFTYSFRIENGVVQGTGTGAYQSATWHLQGVNGKNGSFSCDIPVETTSPFNVDVFGWDVDGTLFLNFVIRGAQEENAAYDCGAKYTGFATTSTYLSDSLEVVQAHAVGGMIQTSRTSPKIGHLGYVETIESGNTTKVRTHEWDLTIQGPAGGGKDDSGGPGPSKARSRGNGTKICTISGTPRKDVLVGTSGHDVICGFGGNDVIRGVGGDDIVFGGPGDDSIDGGPGRDLLFGDAGKDGLSAKDNESDRVVGGPGKDRARVDMGKDRVSAVEKVSG